MRRILVGALVLVAAACAPGPGGDIAEPQAVRLLLAGPVDLGCEAAAVAAADPEGLLRDLRFVVRAADLAVIAGPGTDPPEGTTAVLLGDTGFDVTATPEGGLQALGTLAIEDLPPSAAGAWSARVAVDGQRVVLVTVDPAVPGWVQAAGSALGRAGAGVAVVLLPPPPGAEDTTGLLARWGADLVVTVAGPATSVRVLDGTWGRRTVAVTGLGALLSGCETDRAGTLLEVMVDEAGVIAYRVGRHTHADLRAHFTGWDLPTGDAVLLDRGWWSLARAVVPADTRTPGNTASFDRGDLAAAAVGDVTGDGAADIAAAYRHLFRPSAVSEFWPEAVPVDSLGRSAHLGVFDREWKPLWAAGRIPHPVGALAACDGAVALAYTHLDDPAVVATGAGVWDGFGLRSAPELPGPGTPGCADVDGDGALDPVLLGRPG